MGAESGFQRVTAKEQPKHERFADILRILAAAEPAATPQEANTLVFRTFQEIEKAAKRPPGDGGMGVLSFGHTEKLQAKGRTVYYVTYEKHRLFLGDNGSIDIRRLPATSGVKGEETSPYEGLASVFQKTGADGRGVWETTS